MSCPRRQGKIGVLILKVGSKASAIEVEVKVVAIVVEVAVVVVEGEMDPNNAILHMQACCILEPSCFCVPRCIHDSTNEEMKLRTHAYKVAHLRGEGVRTTLA